MEWQSEDELHTLSSVDRSDGGYFLGGEADVCQEENEENKRR